MTAAGCAEVGEVAVEVVVAELGAVVGTCGTLAKLTKMLNALQK